MNYSDIPVISNEDLVKLKEENFKERLEFITKYVEWQKKSPIKNGVKHRKKL